MVSGVSVKRRDHGEGKTGPARDRSGLPKIGETLQAAAHAAWYTWRHGPELPVLMLIAAPGMLLARGTHVVRRATGQLNDTVFDERPLHERSESTLLRQVVEWGAEEPELDELKRRAATAEPLVLAMLARYPSPISRRASTTALADLDYETLLAIARELGTPRLSDELERWVGSKQLPGGLRAMAALEAARAGRRSWLCELPQLLDDPSALNDDLLRALRMARASDQVEVLRDFIERAGPENWNSYAIVRMLADFDTAAGWGVIRELLRSGDERWRRVVVNTLQDPRTSADGRERLARTEAIEPALVAALADHDVRVRLGAAALLQRRLEEPRLLRHLTRHGNPGPNERLDAPDGQTYGAFLKDTLEADPGTLKLPPRDIDEHIARVAALTRDSGRFFSVTNEGTVTAWDERGCHVCEYVTRVPGAVGLAAIYSRFLAAWTANEITLLAGPRDESCRRIAFDAPLGARSVEVCRDQLIVGCGKTLRILSLQGDVRARIDLGDAGLDAVTGVFASRTNPRVLAICGSTLLVIDLEHRSIVHRFDAPGQRFCFAAFVPFHPALVAVSADQLDHAVTVLYPENGHRTEVARLEDPSLSSFWLSPAGGFLVCGGSTVTLLRFRDRQPVTARPAGAPVSALTGSDFAVLPGCASEGTPVLFCAVASTPGRPTLQRIAIPPNLANIEAFCLQSGVLAW
jgi:hypothetical protein